MSSGTRASHHHTSDLPVSTVEDASSGGLLLDTIAAWTTQGASAVAGGIARAAGSSGSSGSFRSVHPDDQLAHPMSFLSEVARLSAALNRASSMAQLSTDLRVPKVVITGGQSAGKSSLMNSCSGSTCYPLPRCVGCPWHLRCARAGRECANQGSFPCDQRCRVRNLCPAIRQRGAGRRDKVSSGQGSF